MVTSIKNNDGFVVAYIEAWPVGPSGFPKFEGEYLWVHDLWIHDTYRQNGMLQQLIWKMLGRVPYVEYGYWRRHKYNGRISKVYRKEQFTKLCKRMESSWVTIQQ